MIRDPEHIPDENVDEPIAYFTKPRITARHLPTLNATMYFVNGIYIGRTLRIDGLFIKSQELLRFIKNGYKLQNKRHR